MENKRDYLSGAQKRKLQKERTKAEQKLPKLDKYFKKTRESLITTSLEEPISTCDPSTSTATTSKKEQNLELNREKPVSESEQVKNECLLQSKYYEDVGLPEQENNKIEPPYSNSTEDVSCLLSRPSSLEENPLDFNCSSFQTDISFYKNKNQTLTEEVKRFLTLSKPCQPIGPFPKDPVSNRSFSSSYYSFKSTAGQDVHRTWLCYSSYLDGVYCRPCWLFSESAEAQSWREGTIRDWKGLSKKIKVHESSHTHLHSCFTYDTWKKSKTFTDQISDEQKKWKDIFIRIVDVIRTMALCSLPFRGHKESLTTLSEIKPESGNFLNILSLVSRYDSLLGSHLQNDKTKTKYLHHDIQNEIINLLGKSVFRKLIEQIHSSPFFSIIVDSTQDISRVDQMSIVIRHVNIVEVSAGKYETVIKESFLGFHEIKNPNSEGFQTKILDFLKSSDIDIQKCRGQGYDGAATMSGQYSGLQKRIKDIVPNADYVHCAAHNLNLVVNDSVSDISEIRQFYEVVQKTYVFFSESLPRWQDLNTTVKEDANVKNLTLKKLCPTRWASRHDSLIALRNDYKNVMKCLTEIILYSSKKPEVEEALSIKDHLENFDFILVLCLESTILEHVNLTSKALQTPNYDLGRAWQFLSRACGALKAFREDFPGFVVNAKQLANSWGIACTMKNKRKRIVKRFFDELSVDHRIDDPIKSFEIKVFNIALDTVIGQLKNRFEGLRSIDERFSFLKPQNLVKFSNEIIVEKSKALVNVYPGDLATELSDQVISFKNLMADEIVKKKSILEVMNLLAEDNSCLMSCLPDLTTALQLYLTLPVTTATAERSFSKLKLIKSYLRSTMSQTRLSDLALLSIEHGETQKIDINEVVEKFLAVKKRRMGLGKLRK